MNKRGRYCVLSQELLKEFLFYEPETGVFTWRSKSAACVVIGSVAGYFNGRYWRIAVRGKHYSAHRLAWLYVFGEWPKQVIDHINGDKTDNRIANLRDVSVEHNNQNTVLICRSKTGVLGVSKTTNGRYKSIISSKGQCMYLGTFDTAEKAGEAYRQAKQELHKGFLG